MNNHDLENLGEEIKRMVQDAVDSKNFEKLSESIGQTVGKTAEAVKKSVTNTGTKKQGGGMQYTNQPQSSSTALKQRPEFKAPSKIAAGIAAAAGCWLGFGSLWVAIFLSLGATVIGGGFGMILALLWFFLLGGGFLSMGIWGIRRLLKIGRFKKYVERIGKNDYCNIASLAADIGKSDRAVLTDVEYMIKNRWFAQGHLDKQKTCLMLTDKMYQQYLQLERQRALEQPVSGGADSGKKTAAVTAQPQAVKSERSAEVERVVTLGEEYLTKIRACNDAIPGEEISAKIFRIETLVDKIFKRVEQNPKSVSDIRKLLEYYLPTTVKLLEAYADMDAQPVGGENIQAAKKEIEAALDTINIAFEKLLDSLFQEKAWDVSTDISVLHTMLAQEGLTEDGLRKKS